MQEFFEGRMGRIRYLFLSMISMLSILSISFVLLILNIDSPFLYILFLLSFVMYQMMITVKRLHDFNQSGWYSLLIPIPVIGFIISMVIMFKKGDDNINKYGINDGKLFF